MIAYKATVIYTIDGSIYHFPFRYLRKEFVKAKYAMEDGMTQHLQHGVDYDISDETLTLKEVPPAAANHIIIYRKTPSEQQVKFVDASLLKAYDLNAQGIQLLHLAEENTDLLGQNSLQYDETTSTWQGHGRRLVHLADPQDPQDAVTLHYMTEANSVFLKHIQELKEETINAAATATQKAAETASDAARTAANTEVVVTSRTIVVEAAERAENASKDASEKAQEVNRVLTAFNQATLYDPTRTYLPGTCVMVETGEAYRCLRESTGENPITSTKWVTVSTTIYHTFELDENKDLMPLFHPQSSLLFTVDDKGDISVADLE